MSTLSLPTAPGAAEPTPGLESGADRPRAEEPVVDPPPEADAAVLWRVVRLVVEAVAVSVSAVDAVLPRARPARPVAVDVIVGGGAVAGEVAGRIAGRLVAAGRSITAGAARLPLFEGLAGRPRPGPFMALAIRGRRERVAAAADLQRLADALVPAITAAVLDRLDLTALVRNRVALDTLIAEVDIGAVTAKVDVDAIARRVDLDAIVDRLDLPEIIRESTGSISGDIVRGARMQGIEADQAVTGLVSRLFRRGPAQPGAGVAVTAPTAVAAQEAPS